MIDPICFSTIFLLEWNTRFGDGAWNAFRGFAWRSFRLSCMLTELAGCKLRSAHLLQYIQTFLFILLFGHPKFVSIFPYFRQNGASNENHVLSGRRVFNSDFEFLEWKKTGMRLMVLAGNRYKLTDNLSMSFLSTRSRYNCLISRSNRLGRPGYIVEPPDRTMCL